MSNGLEKLLEQSRDLQKISANFTQTTSDMKMSVHNITDILSALNSIQLKMLKDLMSQLGSLMDEAKSTQETKKEVSEKPDIGNGWE